VTGDDPIDALRRSVPDSHRMPSDAADRLEAGLRVAHAARRPVPVPLWRRPVALGALGLLLFVAALATLVIRDTEPSAALVLSDAEGVTVLLPDGSEVVDPEDGFALPEGAVVSIAEGGTVTIDETIIDAVSELLVRDGRLVSRVAVSVPDMTTDTASSPPPTPDSDREDPATTEPERDEPVPTTSTAVPGGDDGHDEHQGEERDDGGDHDERDRVTTTTAPTEPDAPTSTVAPADATVDVSLRLSARDDGVLVVWSVVELAPGWQVVITRRVGNGDVAAVIGPTREAVGEFVDPLPARDGDRVRVRYRILVLDEDGVVIAESPDRSVRR